MDGFIFVEEVRRRPGIDDTPVIMLTSAGRPADAARCQELRVQRYLLKPVRRTQLRDAIVNVFGGAVDLIAVTDADVGVAAPPVAQRPLRILVADDNVINQTILKRMLEKLGHAVTLAANGRETFDIVVMGIVDLVLMDVQMPVMDGLESTAAIRRHEQASTAHIPIIAVTAHAMQGDKERFLAAGMDAYISKPIDRDELLQAIASPMGHVR
jgi:CheY-like chemotaxis protein